jgi:hypothetical protein
MLLLQKPAAADNDKELEEAISRSSDMMKKIDLGEAMAMETEKLQLTASQYKPAKYQYSKDEDTVLTADAVGQGEVGHGGGILRRIPSTS